MPDGVFWRAASLFHGGARHAATNALSTCLLGQKLWDGWFDLLVDPIPDFEIIPRQALTFVAMSLDRMKAKYDAVEATKTAAAKSYATFVANARAKKRKTTAS